MFSEGLTHKRSYLDVLLPFTFPLSERRSIIDDPCKNIYLICKAIQLTVDQSISFKSLMTEVPIIYQSSVMKELSGLVALRFKSALTRHAKPGIKLSQS